MVYENEYENKLITSEDMKALSEEGRTPIFYEPRDETHPFVLEIDSRCYIITNVDEKGIQTGDALRITNSHEYDFRSDDKGLYLTYDELGALFTLGKNVVDLGWTEDLGTALWVMGQVYQVEKDDEKERMYLTPHDGNIMVPDFDILEDDDEEELMRWAQEAIKERLDAGELAPAYPLTWDGDLHKVKYAPTNLAKKNLGK